jgi:hypothetical protein
MDVTCDVIIYLQYYIVYTVQVAWRRMVLLCTFCTGCVAAYGVIVYILYRLLGGAWCYCVHFEQAVGRRMVLLCMCTLCTGCVVAHGVIVYMLRGGAWCYCVHCEQAVGRRMVLLCMCTLCTGCVAAHGVIDTLCTGCVAVHGVIVYIVYRLRGVAWCYCVHCVQAAWRRVVSIDI